MRSITPMVLALIGGFAHAAEPPAPIAFERLTAFDRLPLLADYYSAMESSYDRTGGNQDGRSCLRVENGVNVFADLKGPGCITRIWATNPQKESRLRFYFDGETTPRIDALASEFFGNVGHFRPPLCTVDGNPERPERFSYFSYYCYVPIPFERSLKITGENMYFHHVNYELYAPGTELTSYSKELTEHQTKLLDAGARTYLRAGEDPKPAYRNSRTVSFGHTLEPGEVVILPALTGPAVIDEIRMKAAPSDERALRGLVLRAWWDGEAEPSISSPVGDFFGTGFGERRFKALPVGMTESGYYCYWPMPFAADAVFQIENGGAEAVSVSGTIRSHAVAAVGEHVGRFHARWRRENPTTHGESFMIVETKGTGLFVGCNLSMQMRNWSRSIQFLEGDERVYIDGEPEPRMSGTGAEDYLNGAYYWGHYPLPLKPFHGVTVMDKERRRVAAYRFHVLDPVYFTKRFKMTIEHGPVNNWISDFAATAYWYQREPHGRTPEMPPAHERMPIPAYPIVKVRGAIEAEALLPPVRFEGGHCNNRPVWGNWQDWCHDLSGNSAARVCAVRPRKGETPTEKHKTCSMTLAVPVETAGQYEIVYYVTMPPGAAAQLSIDGQEIGPRHDLSRLSPWQRSRPFRLGTIRLSAGVHNFTFDGQDRTQLAVDCIVLQPVGARNEGK